MNVWSKDRLPVDLISFSSRSSSHLYLISSEGVRTGLDMELLGNRFYHFSYGYIHIAGKVAYDWFPYTLHAFILRFPWQSDSDLHTCITYVVMQCQCSPRSVQIALTLGMRILWNQLPLASWYSKGCFYAGISQCNHSGLAYLSTDWATKTSQKAVH